MSDESLVPEMLARLESIRPESAEELRARPLGRHLGPACAWSLLMTLSRNMSSVSNEESVRCVLQHHLRSSGLQEASACMDMFEGSR
jgi:hypothetical protein